MFEHKLKFSTKKALCVQLGTEAGNEIAELLQAMAERIEQLDRTKVNVTPVVGATPEPVGKVRWRRAA